MQIITTPQKDSISGAVRRSNKGQTMRRALPVMVCTAVLAFCALLCVLPHLAWAYSSSNVTIEASLNNEGDLAVHEQRTVDFTDQEDALTWTFDNLGEAASVQVTGVSIIQNDQETALVSQPFNLEWRTGSLPQTLSYSYDDPEHMLYVFCPGITQTQAVFEVDYVIKDAAVLYADYGELFWQFISPEWTEASQNVSLSLTLPVTDGSDVVAGDTVFAWGHGPADMTANIDETGAVTCQTSCVEPEQFAQVRVLFPTDWLSGIQATDDNADVLTQRFDSVLNEEKAWSDWGNTNFVRLLSVLVVLCLVSVAALVWALVSFIRFKREGESSDAPQPSSKLLDSDIQAARIGRLNRFNTASERDFYATVLQLVDKGALRFNREAESLEAVGAVANALPVGIERHALTVLFKECAYGNKPTSAKTPPSSFDGQVVSLAAIEQFKREKPLAYRQALTEWNSELDQTMSQAGYFETFFQAKKTGFVGVMGALLLASIIGAVIGNHPALLLPGVAAIIIMLVVAARLKRRSRDGLDLYRQCQSLQLWIKDDVSSLEIDDVSREKRCIIDAFALDALDGVRDKELSHRELVDLASRLSSIMI